MNETNIIVCGDLHGDFTVIETFLKKYELKNVSLIVAGDFGIGFKHHLKEKSKLGKLNEKLKPFECILYVVRGNHDDPSYFNGKIDFNLSCIKFVKDYTVLSINDINILCVGGAVSIDRTMRNRYNLGKGRDWWVDETFKYEHEKIKDLNNINVVITHSAPNFAYPYIKSNNEFLWRDLHLRSDLDHERSAISNLYNALIENGNKIDKWFYGHFHLSKTSYYQQTKFIALDINEFKEMGA